MSGCPFPRADSKTGLEALKVLLQERSLLPALEIMHRYVGDAFQITLPGFKPVVMVGPEANRFVLVQERDQFLWRNEADPVTRLLRHGVLVEDGQEHDRLRQIMDPALQRRHVVPHIDAMWHYTNQVIGTWGEESKRDMLVEMRRVALLILMGTLFNVDFLPHLDRLWPAILRMLDYISPGLWILWPDIPRPGYEQALSQIDDYLYQIIRERRAAAADTDDLLGRLLDTPGMSDDLIRDQLLTMLIAGHDTSTALLAWALYLLGQHPEEMAKTQAEVDRVLGDNDDPPDMDQLNQLRFMDQVIKETLRLYPPIHVGNRQAASNIQFGNHCIPAHTRVMMSIYLSHRHGQYWPHPERFMPDRFDLQEQRQQPPLTYIPFGAGPRNCIGAAFAQVEAKVVLARILQAFDLALASKQVHPHMGATLEPRPGVMMQVRRRRSFRV